MVEFFIMIVTEIGIEIGIEIMIGTMIESFFETMIETATEIMMTIVVNGRGVGVGSLFGVGNMTPDIGY